MIAKIMKINNCDFSQLEKLKKKGIVNGCGGKGGFNISKYLRKKVINFSNYNKKKYLKFLKDIKIICNIHDRDFYFGKGLKGFFQANIRLVTNINLLLYWTFFFERLIISIVIFSITSTVGFYYYIKK